MRTELPSLVIDDPLQQSIYSTLREPVCTVFVDDVAATNDLPFFFVLSTGEYGSLDDEGQCDWWGIWALHMRLASPRPSLTDGRYWPCATHCPVLIIDGPSKRYSRS